MDTVATDNPEEAVVPYHPSSVTALVRDADIEIIPFKSAVEKLPAVPEHTTITVTTSAKLGLERTWEFAEAAAKAGHRVVPHLAARQVTDAAQLRSLVGRLDALGITDLYVIGGDLSEAAGPYRDAGDVLEALDGFAHGITSLGVACYPEGHPKIPDTTLTAALHRAQPHATYTVSQMCFDPEAITRWLHGIREDGVTLPLHLGLAAPMQIRKLAELSLKIGVGSSVSYLTKQQGFVGNVLRGRAYRPDALLERLEDTIALEETSIEQLHLFSFNQVAETVAWQADIASRRALHQAS